MNDKLAERLESARVETLKLLDTAELDKQKLIEFAGLPAQEFDDLVHRMSGALGDTDVTNRDVLAFVFGSSWASLALTGKVLAPDKLKFAGMLIQLALDS